MRKIVCMRAQFRGPFITILCSLLLATLCHAVVARVGVVAPGPGLATSPASDGGQTVSSYSLPAAEMRQAEALYRTRTLLYLAGTAYGIAVLALLLALGIAPRYRDLAERLARRRLLQAVIFLPLLLITCGLLWLPFELYGHHLQLSYGLSYSQAMLLKTM